MTDETTNEEETVDSVEAIEAQEGRETPQEPQEGAQEPAEPTQEPEGEQDGDEDAGRSREAAKYRVRLREAEAERDVLASRVEGLQREKVEQIAGSEGRLFKPGGLWFGAELGDMLDDDGDVDRDKVLAKVDEVAREYGLNRQMKPVPSEGRNPDIGRLGDDMAEVIRGRGR